MTKGTEESEFKTVSLQLIIMLLVVFLFARVSVKDPHSDEQQTSNSNRLTLKRCPDNINVYFVAFAFSCLHESSILNEKVVLANIQ